MSEHITRILGKMLSRYVGKEVIIVGNITKLSSQGDSVEITTFDDVKVNITLPNPFDGNAEGILEAWGTVKSRGTVEASWYQHYDTENCEDFASPDGTVHDAHWLVKSMEKIWGHFSEKPHFEIFTEIFKCREC